MLNFITVLLVALGAYLIGSLPTGYIVAYFAGIADIRKHGSGNIGATNVARVLGISYFIPVSIIDAAKAACYLFIVHYYCADLSYMVLASLLLLIGNGYSLFLSFTGGKGIATSIGILYVLQPNLLCILIPIWTCTLLLTGRVGIASAVSSFSLVIIGFMCVSSCSLLILCVSIGLWGVWRHEENLRAYLSVVSL